VGKHPQALYPIKFREGEGKRGSERRVRERRSERRENDK
jgi:hypothetical protein